MSYTDKLYKAMACFYGFFGVTLLLAPKTFWGPKSYFCYWTTMDDSGEWFARICGTYNLAVLGSPYYADISKASLMKVFLPVNIVTFLLFVYAAFFLTVTGPSKTALIPSLNLWKPMVPIGAAFLALNVLALKKEVLKGAKGAGRSPSPAPKSPKKTR
jgi:hypothetical protein